jgi:hypothetical protein
MSGTMLGSKEKRNYIRMNVETEIHCKIRGTKEEFIGFCKNLSHTGIQFITSKNLKAGSELDIILKVSGVLAQPPLEAVLIVKRVNKEAADRYLVSGTLINVK